MNIMTRLCLDSFCRLRRPFYTIRNVDPMFLSFLILVIWTALLSAPPPFTHPPQIQPRLVCPSHPCYAFRYADGRIANLHIPWDVFPLLVPSCAAKQNHPMPALLMWIYRRCTHPNCSPSSIFHPLQAIELTLIRVAFPAGTDSLSATTNSFLTSPL